MPMMAQHIDGRRAFLKTELGLKTKRPTTANGYERGDKPFSRGHIYRLLANPIYNGQIAHKGQLYPDSIPL